jgi:hypothetical protein
MYGVRRNSSDGFQGLIEEIEIIYFQIGKGNA